MSGEERREKILHMLETSSGPISGGRFASTLSVSRQVIVQDIALIRASGEDIVSTNRGYVLQHSRHRCTRVFKAYHTDEQVRDELEQIVDAGGEVVDVFVYHKVYGVIRGELNIRSRRDIDKYVADIESGKSKFLMETTSGYHYHTVRADDEATLDLIQDKLAKKGYLAKLQDYEPVDFWSRTGSA
ncbi:MAG: transcription repressor NadR [Bilifractor sp.]